VRISSNDSREALVAIGVAVSKRCLTCVALLKQSQVQHSWSWSWSWIVGVAAADSMEYVGFGFLAVGACPEESNPKRRPSDKLVPLVDACIVVAAAGESDAVDSPEFVTVIVNSGQGSGMKDSVADIVLEAWHIVVVA
jgi:hypothetical protein